MAKIPTLYCDWLRALREERVNHLSCIEGKGGGKDIHSNAQNEALFVDLILNINYLNISSNICVNLKFAEQIHIFLKYKIAKPYK